MFKREIGVLLESRIIRMEELSRRPTQIDWKEEVATDLETMVDSVMQALENKASQPPRNCWDGGMRSRLETLALQSSALGSVAVIPSEETQERICNNQCECHLGARL